MLCCNLFKNTRENREDDYVQPIPQAQRVQVRTATCALFIDPFYKKWMIQKFSFGDEKIEFHYSMGLIVDFKFHAEQCHSVIIGDEVSERTVVVPQHLSWSLKETKRMMVSFTVEEARTRDYQVSLCFRTKKDMAKFIEMLIEKTGKPADELFLTKLSKTFYEKNVQSNIN